MPHLKVMAKKGASADKKRKRNTSEDVKDNVLPEKTRKQEKEVAEDRDEEGKKIIGKKVKISKNVEEKKEEVNAKKDEEVNVEEEEEKEVDAEENVKKNTRRGQKRKRR